MCDMPDETASTNAAKIVLTKQMVRAALLQIAEDARRDKNYEQAINALCAAYNRLPHGGADDV